MDIRCPSCDRVLPNVPDDFPSRPFCSERCKMADLGQWLDEAYRISTPLGFRAGPEGPDPSDLH